MEKKSLITVKQKTIIAVTIVIIGAIVILSSVFGGLSSQITGAFGIGEAVGVQVDELEETNEEMRDVAEDASPELKDLIEEQADQIEELQETVNDTGPRIRAFYPIPMSPAGSIG